MAQAPVAATGWTEHVSPDGRKYYFHKAKNISAWEKPEELKSAQVRLRPFPTQRSWAAGPRPRWVGVQGAGMSRWGLCGRVRGADRRGPLLGEGGARGKRQLMRSCALSASFDTLYPF
eukprot:2463624-Pleurochrysis_carterae.AAC.4